MSALDVHEHGKHTVDGTPYYASAPPREAIDTASTHAQAWRIFVVQTLAAAQAGRDARAAALRASAFPRSHAPTARFGIFLRRRRAGSPPPGQTFAKSRGRRTNSRPSRHGHKPRRADQMRPRIPFFSRGLLFERDFRISLSLEFCLDRILSLAKIHASKNTPRASRARLENENGMRRSRPRARRGTKNV